MRRSVPPPPSPAIGYASGFSAAHALCRLYTIVQRNARLPLNAATHAQKGQLALEATNFYRSELSPRQGDWTGMRMADLAKAIGLEAADFTDPNSNLGTMSGTLVLQRTLELFKYELPILQSIFTDFSDAQGLFNQTEMTRIIVRPAVQTYSATLGADGRPQGWNTVSTAQTTDVPITLNKHVGVPIVFGQDILSTTVRRLFDEQAAAANYALALYFVGQIMALITPANFNSYAAVTAADSNGIVKVPVAYATYVKALKDFAFSSLSTIDTILTPNEVPKSNRSVLLSSPYHGALRNDPTLNLFWAGSQDPELIKLGRIPQLAGFTPFEAPYLPSTNNLVGFAYHKAALVVKTRLPQDFVQALGVMVPGSVTTVTDPDTGISVLLVQYINLTQGYSEWRIEVLLGTAVGDKRGGLCITSS